MQMSCKPPSKPRTSNLNAKTKNIKVTQFTLGSLSVHLVGLGHFAKSSYLCICMCSCVGITCIKRQSCFEYLPMDLLRYYIWGRNAVRLVGDGGIRGWQVARCWHDGAADVGLELLE